MSRTGWRPAALGVLVALGVGAGIGSVLLPTPQPIWAQPDGSSAATLTVTPREFDDARSVPAQPNLAQARELVLPTGGILRKANCKVGATLESGAVPFLIDDRPVVALHTRSPLWRDLGPGSRGDDVLALQKELARLGYRVSPDGAYGRETAAAVRALWNSFAVSKQNSLPLEQVIWLPARAVVASQCPLLVGQRVSSGDKALVVGGGLTTLTLRLSEVAVDGPRTAVLPNQDGVPVSEGGVITDPAFLEAYSRSRGFAEYLADPSKELTVAVRLTQPVPVVGVPPSALYAMTGSSGCVLADGSATRVEVVASELGQSLVTAEVLPRQVQVDPGRDAPACR